MGGRSRKKRPQAHAAIGSSTDPSTVPILNATSKGMIHEPTATKKSGSVK